jgi:hypothetical protein
MTFVLVLPIMPRYRVSASQDSRTDADRAAQRSGCEPCREPRSPRHQDGQNPGSCSEDPAAPV